MKELMYNGIYFEQSPTYWECYQVKKNKEVATSKSKWRMLALVKTLLKGILYKPSKPSRELITLRAENTELREALRPFADFSRLAHINYSYRQRMTIAVPNPEAKVPHRAETWLGSNPFLQAEKLVYWDKDGVVEPITTLEETL